MAYNLKYQSDFYNYFGTPVSVLIYKRDYVGSVTQVRTQEVALEANFQGEEVNLIGTGATITIVTDKEQFFEYDDLLKSLEKEFQLFLIYNNNLVYQGWSLCDLNERQFLPFSIITLRFVDYVRRLDSVTLVDLTYSGGFISLAELTSAALTKINLDPTVHLNSSLFALNMNDGDYDEFMSQTYLDKYMFYNGPNDYDDGYVTLNKAFQSFGIYFYQYKGQWALERMEDILAGTNWLRNPDAMTLPWAFDGISSQTQILNKQSGDFQYVGSSQILAYESGLKTLILNLQDKQFDSFVLNDYSMNMLTVADSFPNPGALDMRTWYHHQNAVVVQVGVNYRSIGTWVKYQFPQGSSFSYTELSGFYYEFEIQFPLNPEDPVILDINYTQSQGDFPIAPGADIVQRFCLRIDGGPLDGLYLQYRGDKLYLLPENAGGGISNSTITRMTETSKPINSVSMSFNLTDQYKIYVTTGGDYSLESLYNLMQKPVKQKFILMIFPLMYRWTTKDLLNNDIITEVVPETQYLGDVQVSLSNQKILNKLTYYINADFERKEEVDLYFWDLDSINFANGPSFKDENDELQKTTAWKSRDDVVYIPLVDIFAKNKFRNYARTMHRLKGTILHDGYIKPFAIITDDNVIAEETGLPATFVLQHYVWDLFRGTFEIDAKELSDEDITLNSDSGGTPTVPGSGGIGSDTIPPDTPTGLSADQPAAGDPVTITWNAPTYYTAFIVQRSPYWDNGSQQWVNAYKTIYQGSNLTCTDRPEVEYPGVLSGMLNALYQVCTINGILISAYSSPYHAILSY